MMGERKRRPFTNAQGQTRRRIWPFWIQAGEAVVCLLTMLALGFLTFLLTPLPGG